MVFKDDEASLTYEVRRDVRGLYNRREMWIKEYLIEKGLACFDGLENAVLNLSRSGFQFHLSILPAVGCG